MSSQSRVSTSNTVIPFPPRSASFGRRKLAPMFGDLTCLVLVRHGETDKALLVSDNGEASKAVWCPKALLIIDQPSNHGFVVATMSKRFSEQKGLYPRAIDRERFTPATCEALDEAESRAARKRNMLRGHREPMSRHMGRNVFA